MKYSGSLIAVADIGVSRKFYESVLGQKVVLDYGTNISFDGGFSLQEGYAELVGIDPGSMLKQSNNFELYFETEELDDWNGRLKSAEGLEYIHDIKEYPWG